MTANMKHWDRCHKLLSLAVKRHYATLMMTFIKPHKALSTPNWKALSVAVRRLSPSKSCNEKLTHPWSLAAAWPPATLNYTTTPPNNTNGGHFAEWSYYTHNGHTQSTAMASGVWEHKWGLLKYLPVSLLRLVCAHMHKILSHYNSRSLFQV